MWPDLAKLYHFGYFFKSLALFVGLFNLWQIFERPLAIFNAIGKIYHYCKWSNVELAIWSHCSLITTRYEAATQDLVLWQDCVSLCQHLPLLPKLWMGNCFVLALSQICSMQTIFNLEYNFRISVIGCWFSPVWPDWAFNWTLGKFLKDLATINLPKTPTFLSNFCKNVKIYHFSCEIIFGQLL